MSRFARFLFVLVLPVVPGGARAQTAATPAEPAVERRAVTPTGTSVAAAEPDPWLSSYIGLSGRTARMNLAQLDHALEPYSVTYSRLTAEDRTRVRRAFDDLIPSQRFNRYPISVPQSRAIVYLALGPWEGRRPERGCDGPRRRGGHTRCDQAIDSMSRHAAWIHTTALALGRPSNRRPRTVERADLRGMNEYARDMVLGASGCGCPDARADSDALLAATREAMDVYEGSTMPAWMSLGDQRVQRIARLSDSLERTFLRCLDEG